jgi:hypothetical protein
VPADLEIEALGQALAQVGQGAVVELLAATAADADGVMVTALGHDDVVRAVRAGAHRANDAQRGAELKGAVHGGPP